MDVAESGQSNKFLHSQVVVMVGSGLAQRKAATGMGQPGELARPESAGEPVENSPAGALKRGSCTCVQQLAERLKSVWANGPWATRKHLVSGTPKRVSNYAALRGEHIGMRWKKNGNLFCFIGTR